MGTLENSREQELIERNNNKKGGIGDRKRVKWRDPKGGRPRASERDCENASQKKMNKRKGGGIRQT